MTHNALSRSIGRVPMWLLQAMFGAILSGGIAWTTWATVASNKHESKIAVVEAKMDAVKDDIQEIKDGQKEMNQKLDRLIERQSARPDGTETRPLYGRDGHSLRDGR